MIEENVKNALNKAASVALEDWAMTFLGEPPSGFPPTDASPVFEASVLFSGNSGVSGKLLVLANQGLAESVCRSVLGMDSDEELDVISKIDALKELVNVLSGHFLTEAFGRAPVFQLSAPECRDVGVAERDTLSTQYQDWYSPDDQIMGIRVELEGV